MLNVDQYLATSLGGSGQLFTLRTIDDGKSVRTYRASSTVLFTLSVSGTVTKENANMDTDRKVVRLDLKKTDATTGKTATGSVYLVIVAPQLIITDTEMKGVLFGVLEWLTAGAAVPSTFETAIQDPNASTIGDAYSALLQGTV